MPTHTVSPLGVEEVVQEDGAEQAEEESPGGLDGGQVLFALILPSAFADQPVGAPDALQGAVAEGEIELADEAADPEGGDLLPQGDDPLLDLDGSLVGLVMRGAGTFDEARGGPAAESAAATCARSARWSGRDGPWP